MELNNILVAIVVFTIIQRIAELFWSKRNEKILLSEGAKIIHEPNYIFMVLLHTSWLASIFLCAIYQPKTIQLPLFLICLAIYILGQVLRLSAIYTLGKRWSTRIVVLPKAPVIKKGLFKLIRHPNYLGVVLEIFALPLMGGYWKLALFFSLGNFLVLYFRIYLEEKMLDQYNDYFREFSS